MGRTIVLAAALVLAALFAWLQLDPPSARPANAKAGEFSASRAMADVRVLGRAPHPMGSPANLAVRDHLVRRLEGLGLATEVQSADAWSRLPGDEPLLAGGRISNVIGILAGRDRAAPAL
ncbi:MAG TPA: peptidase M20, partial [Phenylobacterium sp.]